MIVCLSDLHGRPLRCFIETRSIQGRQFDVVGAKMEKERTLT